MFRWLLIPLAIFVFAVALFGSGSLAPVAADPGDTVPSSTAPFSPEVCYNTACSFMVELPCGGASDLPFTRYVTLTPGNDIYHTEPGERTLIRGLAGNDQIFLQGNWDCALGDDGDDTITAMPDLCVCDYVTIHGNNGNDNLTGSRGGDILNGGPGFDHLSGGANVVGGNDICVNGESNSGCERSETRSTWNH